MHPSVICTNLQDFLVDLEIPRFEGDQNWKICVPVPRQDSMRFRIQALINYNKVFLLHWAIFNPIWAVRNCKWN